MMLEIDVSSQIVILALMSLFLQRSPLGSRPQIQRDKTQSGCCRMCVISDRQ